MRVACLKRRGKWARGGGGEKGAEEGDTATAEAANRVGPWKCGSSLVAQSMLIKLGGGRGCAKAAVSSKWRGERAKGWGGT
eukprot:scaffold13583_cov103-Amphora_coffeaeformis.AAC.2